MTVGLFNAYEYFDQDLYDQDFSGDLFDLNYDLLKAAHADLLDDLLDRIFVMICRLSRTRLDVIALARANLSSTDMTAKAITCLR